MHYPVPLSNFHPLKHESLILTNTSYPHKFQVNYKLENFINDFKHLKTGETLPDKEIRVGVRIITKRASGK